MWHTCLSVFWGRLFAGGFFLSKNVEFGGPIRAQVLWRCLCAAHLSGYVKSEFKSRGGMMLVAPPGHLKTAFLLSVAQTFDDGAVPVSDLNTAQLSKMKEAMSGGSLRTLILTDMQKLSQRNASVADNLYGNLSAVVDEGYTAAAWNDNPLLPRTIARCSVIGAVTPAYYGRMIGEFADSGFARRFLWSQLRLENPNLLAEAVVQQKQLRFTNDAGVPPKPVNGIIEEKLSTGEIRELKAIVSEQLSGDAIGYQLITKMLAVLRWWYRVMNVKDDPIETLFEYGRCLGRKAEPAKITELFLDGAETAVVNTRAVNTNGNGMYASAVRKGKTKR